MKTFLVVHPHGPEAARFTVGTMGKILEGGGPSVGWTRLADASSEFFSVTARLIVPIPKLPEHPDHLDISMNLNRAEAEELVAHLSAYLKNHPADATK